VVKGAQNKTANASAPITIGPHAAARDGGAGTSSLFASGVSVVLILILP
jgi:hypothetical protein